MNEGAFLYARVSDKKQGDKDLSIPSQIKLMQDYCERKKIPVRKIFREIKSALEGKRPEFDRMIEEAINAEVPPEFILTWNTARFARNSETAQRTKRLLRPKGIRVIAISQEVADDHYGRFMERIFEDIDQLQSEQIGIDTLRGMVENAKQGYVSGGTPAFGYQFKSCLDDRGNKKLKLEINDDEAKIVKLIFQLYVNGLEGLSPLGSQRIVDYLNKIGCRTRSGCLWEKGTILSIIQNPVYSGTYLFNRRSSREKRIKNRNEWVAVSVPAIIETPLFMEAQRIRKSRAPERKSVSSATNPALLTGYLYCGICGARMTLETAKGGRYPYYNCRNFLRKGKSVCPGQRIAKEIIEEAIKKCLVGRLFSRQRIKAILENTLSILKKQQKGLNSSTKEIDVKVKKLSRGLSNILDAVEEWGINKTPHAKDRATALQDEIQNLEEQKQALTRPFTVPDNLLDDKSIAHLQYRIKSAFLDDDPIVARKYFDLLIERIDIHDDQVKITGKTKGLLRPMTDKKSSGENVLTAGGSWLPEAYIIRTNLN